MILAVDILSEEVKFVVVPRTNMFLILEFESDLKCTRAEY